jgi:hypothetical protein
MEYYLVVRLICPGSCSYDGKEGKLVRVRYKEQIQCMDGVSQANSSLADYGSLLDERLNAFEVYTEQLQ